MTQSEGGLTHGSNQFHSTVPLTWKRSIWLSHQYIRCTSTKLLKRQQILWFSCWNPSFATLVTAPPLVCFLVHPCALQYPVVPISWASKKTYQEKWTVQHFNCCKVLASLLTSTSTSLFSLITNLSVRNFSEFTQPANQTCCSPLKHLAKSFVNFLIKISA